MGRQAIKDYIANDFADHIADRIVEFDKFLLELSDDEYPSVTRVKARCYVIVPRDFANPL